MRRKPAHAKIQMLMAQLIAAEKARLLIVIATMFVHHMATAALTTKMFAKQIINARLNLALSHNYLYQMAVNGLLG